MYIKTIFTLSALTLASAGSSPGYSSYFCPFALDGSGMVQTGYCCDGFKPAPHTDKSMIGVNCTDQTNDVVEICPNGFTPKCCYMGGEIICTAEAVPQTEEDV